MKTVYARVAGVRSSKQYIVVAAQKKSPQKNLLHLRWVARAARSELSPVRARDCEHGDDTKHGDDGGHARMTTAPT